MKLEGIMLSEIRHAEKDKFCMICTSYIHHANVILKKPNQWKHNRMVVTRGWAVGEILVKGYNLPS